MLILGSPFIVAYLLWRGVKQPSYWRSLRGRFGWLPFQSTAPGGIWLHAVSVGEVFSAIGLIEKLRANVPGTPLYVSVSTIAGRKLAEEKLAGITEGVFYVPLDFVFAVRRVLRFLRPSLVVVMETEIWPNLWRESKRFGAQLVIVNGRISDRALPKYERFHWFFAAVLQLPDRILAQSGQDYQRFLALGALPEKTENAGNLKYDLDVSRLISAEDLSQFLADCGAGPILIAASTMPGIDSADLDEDDVVLGAWAGWAARFPRLLMILAPRRPDCFELVAAKLKVAGINTARRTALEPIQLPGVLLLDSMGELGGLFFYADVVFMGGTIVRRGGHNILEPALFGKPVVAGPHMENFAEIAADFTAGGGLVRFQQAEQLEAAVRGLLEDKDKATAVGSIAKELALERRGATGRIMTRLEFALGEAVPRNAPSFLGLLLLGPLSKIWGGVSGWNLRRKSRLAVRLRTPLISIGGLSMGGAGKTPFVLWLGAQLKLAGETPAFLTRGYRRGSAEAVSVFAAGEACPVARTGEEAQMLVRSGIGPVGIASKRAAAATVVEESFAPSVFLMDDGFQHTQLARECDIVLIDTLDVFDDAAPFPLGWLRESLAGLGRADLVVLTRTRRGRSYAGLVEAVRQYHAGIPVFLSRVAPLGFVSATTAQAFGLEHFEGRRVAAFCGLGNPASFWDSLAQLGCNVVFRWAFGDHHVYKPQELKRLEYLSINAKAEVLVTTQKDLFNLPAEVRAVLETLPLYWLEITTEVDNAAELLELVALDLKKKTLHG